MNNKELAIDTRWSEHPNIKQELINVSNSIRFINEVPVPISERFKMVKKLIKYSLYEYEFLDVALERSLSCFEFAFKKKYSILESKESKLSFHKLIEWIHNKISLEDTTSRLESLRELRNSLLAHPSYNTILGLSNIELIIDITRIINDVFNDKDIDLRKQRIDKLSKERRRLKEIVDNGFLVKIDEDFRLVVYANLSYYENRNGVNNYYYIFILAKNGSEINKDMRNSTISYKVKTCNPINTNNELIKGNNTYKTNISIEDKHKIERYRNYINNSEMPLLDMIMKEFGDEEVKIRNRHFIKSF